MLLGFLLGIIVFPFRAFAVQVDEQPGEGRHHATGLGIGVNAELDQGVK